MRTSRSIFVILLSVLSASAAAAGAEPVEPVPVVFARAGRTAEVWLWAVNLPSMKLALRAYGRAWADADARNEGDGKRFVVTFDVPLVRVPVVFSVTSAELEKPELAQVVVYPDRDVAWSGEKDERGRPATKVLLYAAEAPQWFSQWSAAVGLPVKVVEAGTMPPVVVEADGTRPEAVLVVGRDAVGRRPADWAKLAAEKKLNVLVLDADWFSEASGAAAVVPRNTAGGLVEIVTQRWPKPLGFTSHRSPWPAIANRWAWIVGDGGLPLVEEVRPTDADQRVREGQCAPAGPRVIASYLPWAEQLGRSESADATLLSLLKAAAQPRPELRWRMVDMVWPTADPADQTLAPERPVLRAALAAWPVIKEIPARLHVLDLRGPNEPPTEATQEWKDVERSVERATELAAEDGRPIELLILGDDKALDAWKWLALDRAKMAIGRRGVLWLPDDRLPRSKENQIRLMLKLTELGVALVTPGEKEMAP